RSYFIFIIFISCRSERKPFEDVKNAESLTGKDLFNVVTGDIVEENIPPENSRIPKRDLFNEFTLDWPYKNIEITSPYGFRLHPVLKTIKYHRGLDLANNAGTRVLSVAAGSVVKAFYNGVYGNIVEIEHQGGLISQYAHLDEILVFPGDAVEAGTLIGLTGNTGRSTGAHLHLGFIAKKHSVDPFYFFGRVWTEKSLSPDRIPHVHGWK
ncbi:M23 family metallopeptidase, partial [Myxococcota bacterium]|nr:M23 family metallopeptidase [Myxococcota bacterium]